MKITNLVVASLTLVIGCERPITEPIEFARLCGPPPTQIEAETAAREWAHVEHIGHETISFVKIEGPTDRRFGVMNLGVRHYGWKVTFYAKSANEIRTGEFTPKLDLLWHRGKFFAGNDGY